MEPTDNPTDPNTTPEQPTPDPRRRSKLPSLRNHRNPIFDQLKPFSWPVIDDAFVPSTLEHAQTAARGISFVLDEIEKSATAAAQRVMDDFASGVNLELLDETNRRRVTDDAVRRASEASKAKEQEQREFYANRQSLHEINLAREEAVVEGVLSCCPDPASLMDISVPATSERLNWANQLRLASYQSLVAWSAKALTTNNPALAAAALNELSARGKSAPISPREFAERAGFGEKHAKLVNLRDEIHHIRRNLADHKTKIERGRGSLMHLLEKGIREAKLKKQRELLQDE